MISCMYIKSCIWVIGFLSLAGAVPWVDPSLELLDELNDAEVYRAIVNSMNEWQRKHDLKKTLNRTKREDPSVCYKDLGCFEASGPFGYLDMLPSKPQEINTKFLMYPARTRRRRSGSAPAEVPFEKLNDAFEWAKSGFNKSLPTKVLIHGFGSDCGYIWAYEIRSALMAVEEVNTICVDWSNGASLPNYVKASANTRLVGKQVSLLLRGLVEKNGLSLRNTHLIGFSLGAHIAGFAGADLGNLSRITGLDPAGPLFESQDTRARLDETDAAFVDVIHSNGENLILGGLGSSQPMGHVDFYPNGGRMQKGCSHLFVGAVSDIIWSSAIEGRSLCNHRRAYKFFIDSVSPRCHFPAFPCNSYDDFIAGKCFPCTDERKCGNMGYYADRSKGRGQLYLVTRDEEPFCAHQYLVKIESTPSPVPIKSYGKIQITLIGDSFLNETFMMTKKEDEEMKLGESISRILVPHPILSQPTRIEILYTAYSGWLSSGLTQWKVDKVTLMDSFGKVSSVCKKSLLLESGKPVTLPLYPGECNSRKVNTKEIEDRMQQAENKHPGFNNYNSDNNISKDSGFTPTQVVKIGLDDNSKEYEVDRPSSYKSDLFGTPWKAENENNLLDSEAESSRAFNTRIIKADKLNKNLVDSDGLVREVVEPILKAPSTKHARSHDPEKDKPEITEPILGPTTAKSSTTTDSTTITLKVVPKNDTNNEGDEFSKREMYYKENDWVPKEKTTEKWKRQDESKAIKGFGSPYRSEEPPPNNNPLEAIVTTVQFLPQRLARMFEQAEKYARETILPLVSTYTPRFISDFIGPRETPRYVPLHYEEDEIQRVSSSRKVGVQSEERPRSIDVKTEPSMESSTEESVTTPYSHIQRITKKKASDKIDYIFPTSQPVGTIEALISTSTVPSTSTSTSTESEGLTVTPNSKSTNTYSFNKENSHFSIEIDSSNSQNNKPAKQKRQNNSKSLQNIEVESTDSPSTNFRPLESLVNALQNLPESLSRIINQAQNFTRTEGFGRILSQAQNFTRTNILPLMENYDPTRITDLFWIRPKPNITMNITSSRTNDSHMQEERGSINWSFEQVFTQDSTNSLSSTGNPLIETVVSPVGKTNITLANDIHVIQDKPKKPSSVNTISSVKPEEENIVDSSSHIIKETTTTSKPIVKTVVSVTDIKESSKDFGFTQTKVNEPASSTEHLSTGFVEKSDSNKTTIKENFSSVQNIDTFLGSTTRSSIQKSVEDALKKEQTTTEENIVTVLQAIKEEEATSKVPDLTDINFISTSEKFISSSSVSQQSADVASLSTTTEAKMTLEKSSTVISNSIETTTKKTYYLTSNISIPGKEIVKATTRRPETTTISNISTISENSLIPSYTSPKSISVVSPLFNLIPVAMDPVVKYVSKSDSKPVSLKTSYVQKIPKKGESVTYHLPNPFTIVIDPNDLTTSSSTSTTEASLNLPSPQKAFVSYIQKIPKKGEKLKMPSYKVLRTHPMVRDFSVKNKIITLKNQFGVDMTYKITSDGRFEI